MKVVSLIAVFSAILIAVIINATSPSSAGPLGILVFFACLYVLFICLAYIIIVVSQRIVAKFFRNKNSPEVSWEGSRHKAYYYSTAIALAPTIYIGMQSMGDVGIFEVVLLIIFELLACFFIYKRY